MDTKLDDTNRITKDAVDTFKELQNQLDVSASTLIPLLRTYLEEVRNIRMAFGREVIEIMRSVRELDGVTKSTEKLGQITESIIALDKALNSDLKSKITSVFNV